VAVNIVDWPVCIEDGLAEQETLSAAGAGVGVITGGGVGVGVGLLMLTEQLAADDSLPEATAIVAVCVPEVRELFKHVCEDPEQAPDHE
jgi:hypothetical protein